MPRMRLTNAAVRRLKPPAAGQTDYFDELLPSFGLRVSAAGRKSWFVFYRVKDGPQRGKQRRYTIKAEGLGKAREQARDVLRQVDMGAETHLS